MKRDIGNFVTHLCRCIKKKRPHILPKSPMEIIQSRAPFQPVSLDFVHLEQSKGGYEYILVIVDHFTWFAQACVLQQVQESSSWQVIQWLYAEVWVPRQNFARSWGRIWESALPSFRRMLWYGAIEDNTLPSPRELEKRAAEPDTPIRVAYFASTPELSGERQPE